MKYTSLTMLFGATLPFGAILLCGALCFSACSRTETPATTSESSTTVTTTENADSAAATRVAGDKSLIEQTLILAEARGTLNSALNESARDSGIADEMLKALQANGYLTAAQTTQSRATRTTARKATVKTTSTGKTVDNRDALDKANDALDKADQTVRKSGEVIKKSEEVTRKADEILRGRR